MSWIKLWGMGCHANLTLYMILMNCANANLNFYIGQHSIKVENNKLLQVFSSYTWSRRVITFAKETLGCTGWQCKALLWKHVNKWNTFLLQTQLRYDVIVLLPFTKIALTSHSINYTSIMWQFRRVGKTWQKLQAHSPTRTMKDGTGGTSTRASPVFFHRSLLVVCLTFFYQL